MEKQASVGKSFPSAKERGWDDEDDFDEDLGEEVVRPRPETHPDNADRLVPPSQVRKKPGSVFTRGEITLHTNMGHRMFYGRRAVQENGKKKPMIIGLVRFITNINSICDLAKTGDPYADHCLLKLEQTLIDAREDILDTKQFLLDMLVTGSSTSRVSIKSGISESPVTLPLVFKHKQYGFQGAELVGLYDEVVQLALNAKDAAWLSPNEFKKLVGEVARKVRNCFWISHQYKYSGALREDFIANNQRAQAAVERMGFKLPEDILIGQRRPVWMPYPAVTPKKKSVTTSEKADAPVLILETGTKD